MSDLPKHPEGVDRPGKARERDDLQERLVEPRRRHARPERRLEPSAKVSFAAQRGGHRDLREDQYACFDSLRQYTYPAELAR